MNNYPLIRKIYLYTFALIGLVLIIFGSVRLVGLGLRTYVFTKADSYYEYPRAMPTAPAGTSIKEENPQPSNQEIEEYQKNLTTSQRQKDAAESLAMIIIGLPIYLYHWKLIKKES